MITPPAVKQMYDEISKENKERELSKKKGEGKGKKVDDDDIVVVDEEKEEKNGKRKEVTKKSLPEKKIAKSGSEFSSEGSDEEEEEEEVKESTTRRMSQRLSTSGTRSSTSAKSGMSSTDLNKRNEHVTTPIAPSKKQVLKKNPALSSDQEPSPQDQLKSMQSKLLTPIYRIDQRTTAIEETGEDIKTALSKMWDDLKNVKPTMEQMVKDNEAVLNSARSSISKAKQVIDTQQTRISTMEKDQQVTNTALADIQQQLRSLNATTTLLDYKIGRCADRISTSPPDYDEEKRAEKRETQLENHHRNRTQELDKLQFKAPRESNESQLHCVFCGKDNHDPVGCLRVVGWMERRELLEEKDICFKCLQKNNRPNNRHIPCPEEKSECKLCRLLYVGTDEITRSHHHQSICTQQKVHKGLAKRTRGEGPSKQPFEKRRRGGLNRH